MAHSTDVMSLIGLLGRAGDNPVGARQYRSVAVTTHAWESGSELRWRAQGASGGDVACVVYAQAPLSIEQSEGEEIEVSTGAAFFLHPHREHNVRMSASGTVLCIWVPWGALAEIEEGLRTPRTVLTTTPLAAGLRAFAAALIAQSAVPNPYTDYMVERIVAEMVFAVLVEAVAHSVSGPREARAIDRARSLMLIRRGDPEFGVTEIARDLHMSLRQVQRLFAAQGSSPAEELRRLRVELAREMLGDATYEPLSVAEIAAHAGFGTSAAMRRAFAALGLPNPREMRQAQTV